MKQLNFIRRGKLSWLEVPEPKLKDGIEAIVKPLYVSRCDLDFGIIYGATPLPGPIALGHEMVGEISELGEDVKNFRIGDLVMVPWHINCGSCSHCNKGLLAFCSSVADSPGYGFGYEWGGALQELVRVPYANSMLKKIPKGVLPEQAVSAADNLADGYRCVAPYLKENPAQSVLILGGVGSCGLYAVESAIALGVKPVFTDTDLSRLELAKQLGAEAIEAPHSESPGKFDLVVDSTNTRAGLITALESLEPGGTCACVSVHFKNDISVPYWKMYNTGVTLKVGRANVGAYTEEIFDLISEGRLRPEKITTHAIHWKDAVEGYGQRATKLLVKF
ncbi:zinc-dependent alcohol dehydrogenase [Leptospira hartskeerlii]|nr:alcohol dehydrogenase catalytic domain-containing protein [Leptospira hartskeerlii]